MYLFLLVKTTILLGKAAILFITQSAGPIRSLDNHS
jgi:hypothetical protein